MGKGARKKKEKEVNKKEKSSLIERTGNEYFGRRNIEAMEQVGLQELCVALTKVQEKKIKIDPQIILQGIKNPLVTIFTGFSTRKLFDALTRKKKLVKYTCIIEPDMGVFKHLIMTEDISDLILAENVDIIVGESSERLINVLFGRLVQPMPCGASRSTMIESMESVVDPFQYKMNDPIPQKILNLIQVTKKQIKLSMGCSSDQFTRFKLMIQNIKNMFNAWNIKDCYKKFADVPVFVLGGGPSLEGFIEEYKSKEEYKNSLIIACDAVLRKLLENGIKPHIVTRCERKLTNIFKGITKEMTKGIYYAAYPWTDPEFFDLFDDSFYLFRQNGVCQFSKISHANVDGGVSSGNAALELAINLGAKNIILSGLDLVKDKEGKTHVGGTEVEFDIEKSKAKHVEINTNSGQKRTTIPVWQRCLNEYMQSIDKHRTICKQEFTIYNTAYHGAVIPMTEYKPLKEITVFSKKQDASKMLLEHRSKLSKKEKDEFENIVKGCATRMEEIKTELKIVDGLAEDAVAVATQEVDKIYNIITKDLEANNYSKIISFRKNQASLDKLWANVSDQYENSFRKKLYPDPIFNRLILDVLQLDTYSYENQIAAGANTIDHLDERAYNFYKITSSFTEKCKYYVDEFIKLFKSAEF